MSEPDKLVLYALVRGLRPLRVLEIGARWGGGARIISSALENSGSGMAVRIDPETKAFRPTSREMFGRYELLEGYSPQAISIAVRKLGGPVEFALIDAMHTDDHVLADFTGLLPHLAKDAHVLMHDMFHVGINAAIGEALHANPELIDCGFMTKYPGISDAPVAYQGLRLIRRGAVEGEFLIKDSFRKANRQANRSPSV